MFVDFQNGHHFLHMKSKVRTLATPQTLMQGGMRETPTETNMIIKREIKVPALATAGTVYLASFYTIVEDEEKC